MGDEAGAVNLRVETLTRHRWVTGSGLEGPESADDGFGGRR